MEVKEKYEKKMESSQARLLEALEEREKHRSMQAKRLQDTILEVQERERQNCIEVEAMVEAQIMRKRSISRRLIEAKKSRVIMQRQRKAQTLERRTTKARMIRDTMDKERNMRDKESVRAKDLKVHHMKTAKKNAQATRAWLRQREMLDSKLFRADLPASSYLRDEVRHDFARQPTFRKELELYVTRLEPLEHFQSRVKES